MKVHNATILEPIVSFKTAELAMRKGFDYETCPLYRLRDKKLELPKEPEEFAQYRNWNQYSDSISAPTQSLLCKWLRDEHRIDMYVISAGLGYICHYNAPNSPREAGAVSGNKYEEALEQGLFLALELIETNRKNLK